MLDVKKLDQFEKYLMATASIFHDIYVPRYNIAGDVIKYITVPIVFAQNDKLYDIANSNTLINQLNTNTVETNYPVPSMSLEITDISQDDDRKINELNNLGDNDEVFTPIPIKLLVTLNIETKKSSDITKILEHIFPIFPNKQSLVVNTNDTFSDEIKVKIVGTGLNFPVDIDRTSADMYTFEFNLDISCKIFKVKRTLPTTVGYEFGVYTINNLNNEIETLLNN